MSIEINLWPGGLKVFFNWGCAGAFFRESTSLGYLLWAFPNAFFNKNKLKEHAYVCITIFVFSLEFGDCVPGISSVYVIITIKPFLHWFGTTKSEASEPNHFLTTKRIKKNQDFPEGCGFNRGWPRWPPMIISREGPTQSSIAEHFFDYGCWLIHPGRLLIWNWHYRFICPSLVTYRRVWWFQKLWLNGRKLIQNDVKWRENQSDSFF